MGESLDDRCAMLTTLANLDPQPESVPVNALVADRRARRSPIGRPVDPLELVRMIATARILMPKARVRLSAGRLALSREAQVLCFLAGANSIFYGEKLLTTGNPDVEADLSLLRDAGLRAAPLEGGRTSDRSRPASRSLDAIDIVKHEPWKQPWWQPTPGDGPTLRSG